MKPNDLLNAMNDVDEDLVRQAETGRKAGKTFRPGWAALAACALLALGIGGYFLAGHLLKKPQETPAAKERYKMPVAQEVAMVWPWEYQTPMERYAGMTLNGNSYGTRAQSIRENLLGEPLGTCEAEGYDLYTDTVYPESFEVRAIRGIDPAFLAAVNLEGTWVVFLREDLTIPATLGEWMDACSLQDSLPLDCFCKAEDYETESWYRTDSGNTVWQVLSEYRSAPGSIEDSWTLQDRRYISFTATSEALGVYKKVLTVTEDGYLFTNLMEYAYVYRIGEEAAARIIKGVTEHASETALEPFYPMLAGVLTEIGDGYVLIDDTSLCENASEGIVYKVLTDDPRFRRCLEFPGGIAVGDVVVVEYSGDLDTAHENTVTGAFSMSRAVLTDEGAEVPE